MSYYVEIPAQHIPNLQFPEFCPFTLNAPAKYEWFVKGTTKTDALTIPGVPFFITTGRDVQLRIPVSFEFARLQHRLAVTVVVLALPCLLLIGINAAIHKFDPLATVLMIGPMIAAGIYGFKKFLQRRVWIDFVGERSIEIAFKRGDYADRFCDLNGLEYRRKFLNFRRSGS